MHRLVFTFFILAGACLPAPVLAATAATSSAAQVQKQAVRVVEVMAQTQKETDAWASEEARLLDQAEQLQDELERVGRQRRKTEAYAADQQQKIDELTRRLEETAKLRHDLEPLLDRTLTRLSRDGQAWPDFLARPRTDRLAQVAASLNDYDLGLAQKAKLVLDTLAHEARLGLAVEVTDQEFTVAGRLNRGRVIRLGGLAVYALDAREEQAWVWDRQAGQFNELDGWNRKLAQMADMAQRKRLLSLVEVPLGALARPGEAK
ncbi:MAG: DUF3450 family protein [Thermodesulfobacteriota bacterium]